MNGTFNRSQQRPPRADEGDQPGRCRSIKMILANPTKSDQKNELRWTGTYGQAWTIMDEALQIVAEVMVGRSSRDCGRARWLRGNAERMNGIAKGLSDRNTFITCFTGERGLGLEGNVRLNSLKFAYVRLLGKKMLEAAVLISGVWSVGPGACIGKVCPPP